MNSPRISSVACLILASAVSVGGQVVLNNAPSRGLGQAQLTVLSSAPNLVEGRELNQPTGLAIDTSVNPPALFIADTGNNRVLGWRNAAQFKNGAPADVVIGQPDRFSTFPQGPGRTNSILSAGLSTPTAVITDARGGLYVADSGNNRVLRFPQPLSGSDQLPDLIIGQPDLNTITPNTDGISERTIFLNGNNTLLRGAFAFDKDGNLFFSDAGNHRVLRYRASDLKPGSPNQPAADMLFGQPDFLTATPLPLTAESRTIRDRLTSPGGIAIDPAGRLYVSDSLARVVVYDSPLFSGRIPARILGIRASVLLQPGQPPPPQISETSLANPEAIFFSGSNPAVVDSRLHRIVLYDPFERWPAESAAFSPPAKGVFGQADFTSQRANRGQPEPSNDSLRGPLDAAMLGDELFVLDSGNNRVLVLPRQSPMQFQPATRVLGQDDFKFGAVNLAEGREFNFADRGALLVDSNSNPPRLYVADSANHRILGYRDLRTAKPGAKADLVIGQRDFGSAVINFPGNDPEKPTDTGLFLPIGLALDSAGGLYVADSGNGRILRFPKPFDTPAGEVPKADLVLGQSSFTFKITDPSAKTLSIPWGLAFSGDDGMLVSDAAHNRVLLFGGKAKDFTNGMPASKVYGQPDFVSTRSGGGDADNRMASPRHIATDTDGRLYVADTGNSRLMIFDQVAFTPSSDARAAIQLQLVTQGGRLSNPRGVFVSPDTGEIWVADTGGLRAVRYPKFDDLPLSFQGNAVVFDVSNGFGFAPLAVAQDNAGALLILDSANRIAIHFPGVAAINAANSLPFRALAPGMIASLYPRGGTFAAATENFSSLPLPRVLADTEVRVADQPAPVFFVSPSQINFLVPSSAPVSGTVDVEVVRRSTGQVVAAGALPMERVSPGLFTVSGTGNGQLAALNQDNTPNSEEKPAARGSIIQLFGTGQGVVPGAPPDGSAPSGQIETDVKPRVIINTGFVDDADVVFSGLAPGLVGVWQVNVKIPMSVPPAPAIIVAVVHRSIASVVPGLRTTIAVKE
jgi:uncharacterized protein (TIGR03437 family)